MNLEKRSVYHSILAREGEVELQITSGKKSSKFKKPGESGHFYVSFRYDGQEHDYLAETEECADALAEYQGHTILASFTGRDSDAAVEIIEDLGKKSGGSSKPVASKPVTKAASVTRRSEDPEAAYKAARVATAKALTLYRIAFAAAKSFANETQEMGWTCEDVRAVATTLYIETKGTVDVSALPTSAPASTPKRKPEPEPEPEPEPDDLTVQDEDIDF